MTVRAGQWKAPTRFLPCGRSIAVLPPIAASTWATRLVATGVQAMPRRYARCREPGRVRRAAAAERDDRAAPVEAQVLPEAVDRGERLRLLARRQLVRLRETRAEGELGIHAVDAGDVRIRDEGHLAVAGDELTEPLQRAALDVDTGGREDDVVAVARSRVRDVCIERCTQLEPVPELGLVAGQWTVAATRPEPRRLDVDGQMDDDRALVAAARPGISTAPPPSSITTGSGRARASRTNRASISRNAGSPWVRTAPGSDRAPGRSRRRRRRTADPAGAPPIRRRSSCRLP